MSRENAPFFVLAQDNNKISSATLAGILRVKLISNLSEKEKDDAGLKIEPSYCRTPEYLYKIPACN